MANYPNHPTIVITQKGNLYSIDCHGRFGGGYSATAKSREDVVAMLARDARRYDCGDAPITIIAPEDIKAAAGISNA